MVPIVTQSYFIRAPTFTEASLPDQTGRVHLVTGGYTGVGYQLTKYLLGKNATVYIAGRSRSKFSDAAKQLATELSIPETSLRLHFIQLDLSDLNSVLDAADAFLAQERRLDVLTNNAGVMFSHPDARSAQGYENQLATNVLGPYLFTSRLLPLLQRTAELGDTPPGSVRVTWAGSLAVEFGSLAPASYGALDAEAAAWTRSPSRDEGKSTTETGSSTSSDSGAHTDAASPASTSDKNCSHRSGSGSHLLQSATPMGSMQPAVINYLRSKVGNVYLAEAFAEMLSARSRSTGAPGVARGEVLSVAWNPGNLRTELTRHTPGVLNRLSSMFMLHPPKLGGYTELFAGWAPEVAEAYGRRGKSDAAGSDSHGQHADVKTVYVIPWGQVGHLPGPVKKAILKDGKHDRLVHWCKSVCDPIVQGWEAKRRAGGQR